MRLICNKNKNQVILNEAQLGKRARVPAGEVTLIRPNCGK